MFLPLDEKVIPMELEKHYKGSQKTWSCHHPTEGWKKRMRRSPSALYLLPYTAWGSLSGTNGTYHTSQRPGMALHSYAGPVLGKMSAVAILTFLII